MAQEGLPTRTDVWITEASQEFPPIVSATKRVYYMSNDSIWAKFHLY